MGKLEQALTSALEAAERQGVPRSRLIIGIVGEYQDDGTPYATHVGRAVTDGEIDSDAATTLHIVAQALTSEAGEQGRAAYDDARCPKCDGPRVVLRFRRGRSKYQRLQRYECMDCNYKGPDR